MNIHYMNIENLKIKKRKLEDEIIWLNKDIKFKQEKIKEIDKDIDYELEQW